jgi:predicted P-loop ATPase/GTPase
MRITAIGSDYIRVNEDNYSSKAFQRIPRVHLIKLDFAMPTFELVNQVLHLFPKTNRFVIEDNIRDYNSILRRTEKKYYVMNKKNTDIISFFRKNNKILFNMMNMSKEERDFFLMDGIFEDVLRNTEVIAVSKKIYDEKMEVLDKWKGNVIIVENEVI